MIQKFGRLCLALILAIFVAACGNSNSTDFVATGGQSSTDSENPSSVLDQELVNARVVLPPGFTGILSGLTLNTINDDAGVAGDGSVSLQKFVGGPQFSMVLDADGDPVLIGWLEEGAEIDVESTASVLMFLGLGAAQVEDVHREKLVGLIAQLPETAQLATEVAAALVRNPKALSNGDPQLTSALRTAVESAVQSGVLARIASEPNPGALQSGVRLNFTDSANEISLTNTYLRPVHAFIRRVSYVVDDNGTRRTIDSKADLLNFEISSISGVRDLVGGLNDAIKIIYGIDDGNPVAYTEVTSGEHVLPTVPNSVQTNYKVVVVGPGTSLGESSQLEPDEVAEAQKTSLFFVGKLTFDTVMTFMVPQIEGVDERVGYIGSKDLIVDLINEAVRLKPDIADKAYAGDIAGALFSTHDLLVTSNTFKNIVFEGLSRIVFAVSGNDKQVQFLNSAEKITAVLGAVDTTLAVFDTSAIGGNLALSSVAEVWDLEVLPAEIKINPEELVIAQNQTETLTVTVPEIDNGVSLIYSWSSQGQFGTLQSATNPQNTNTFQTTANTVDYTAGETQGVERVRVEVFEVNGNQRTSIGSASIDIEVKAVAITPGQVTLLSFEEATFTVNIPEEAQATATFEWDLANDTGLLSALDTQSVDYQVRDIIQPPATDTISVKVFVENQGQRELFGEATAAISIIDLQARISPGSTTATPGVPTAFTAELTGALPQGFTIEYQWQSVNGLGNLSATTGESIEYTARTDISLPQTDMLRLTAVLDNGVSQTELSRVEAAVLIGNVSTIFLSPQESAFKPGNTDSIGLSVAQNNIQELSDLITTLSQGGPATARFRWTIMGNAGGTLRGGGTTSTTVETTTGSIEYLPSSGASQGQRDEVKLEIFIDQQDGSVLFGEATAGVSASNWVRTRVGLNEIKIYPDEFLESLEFANGSFLARLSDRSQIGISQPVILRSPNGQNWVEVQVSREEFGWNGFATADNHILTDQVGLDSLNFTNFKKVSVDAQNFTTLSSSLPFFVTDIAFGNGVYTAVGWHTGFNDESRFRAATSGDLSAWLEVSSPPEITETVEFFNGLFYAGGLDLATSPDGRNWTKRRTNPIGSFVSAIEYGNGRYIALLQRRLQDDDTPDAVLISTDGITWEEVSLGSVSLPASNRPRFSDLEYHNGRFYLCGGIFPGFVLSSSDGRTWILEPGSTQVFNLRRLRSGNGVLVAVSDSSSILTLVDE